MPKRKSVRFAEADDVGPSDSVLLRQSAKRRPGDQTVGGASDGYDIAPGPSMGDETRSVKIGENKHTLDSDEEVEEDVHKLNVEEVDGQEEATIDFDDQTKITPFNMTEELEEGFYDAEGNFVYDKKKEIKDSWLDNIDWAKVKKDAGNFWHQENGDEASEIATATVDRTEVFEQIVKYMQPNETITKTLKRLGGNKDAGALRKQRWEAKKKNKPETKKENEEVEENKLRIKEDIELASKEQPIESSIGREDVVILTELVDKLVSDGEFEIYGYSYEKLKFEIDKVEEMKKFRENLSSKAEIKAEDNDLDMFADNIDEKSLGVAAKISIGPMPEKKEQAIEQTRSDEVGWEFKWTDEDVPIHGPFSSQQMQNWADEEYFKDGVFVRRVGQSDAKFYSSKRIDFELYM